MKLFRPFFYPSPLQHQLTTLTLVTTAATLVITFGAFLLYATTSRDTLLMALPGAVLLGSGMVYGAIHLARWLHQHMPNPIDELTQAIARMVKERNYTLPLPSSDDKEYQELTLHISQIANDLNKLHEELDAEVAKRTETLSTALKQCEYTVANAGKNDPHKNEWIRNMSHEFRTPVHGILSFAKFGLDDALDEKVPRSELHLYFDRILQSTERLQYLINGILDIAASEAGRINLIFSHSDLASITENVIKELHETIHAKQITVELQKPGISTLATFDAPKMNQVVTNLLGNSLKFSPDNSAVMITITKSTLPVSDTKQKDALLFTISDEGPGIPAKELEEIFEPFKQSSRTNNQSGGTGIGLSVARNMIRAHGGNIWAENNSDKGASFFFLIPIEQ